MFNTHHYKTNHNYKTAQNLKKKTHTFSQEKKNAITINKKYHKSSYKYEATVYKI